MPMYYHKNTDTYEEQEGSAGASNVRIVGPDGQSAVNVTDGKLDVSVTDVTTKSKLDLRGIFIDRPEAPVAGTTYWAVDKKDTEDEFTFYNGTEWVEI